MRLKKTELRLAFLGLLTLGLAGAEAGAQVPPPNDYQCENYVPGCQAGCMPVTQGVCYENGIPYTYNQVKQTPVQIGQCAPYQGQYCPLNGTVSPTCKYQRHLIINNQQNVCQNPKCNSTTGGSQPGC